MRSERFGAINAQIGAICRAVTLAAAVMIAASPCPGDVITAFSDSLAVSHAPNTGFSVEVPLFDPALGTLSQVDFTVFDVDGDVRFGLANPASPISILGEIGIAFDRPDTTSLLTVAPFRVFPFLPVGSLPEGAPLREVIAIIQADGDSLISASDLTLFTASAPGAVESIMLPYSYAFPSVAQVGGDPVTIGPILDGRFDAATLQINYQFESGAETNAVPEPSSLILLGTGALALLGCRARRRRNRDGVLQATSCGANSQILENSPI